MDTVLRSILVGIGPREGASTLAFAAALALRENARLTVLAAVIKPSPFTWATPMPVPFDPLREAEEECVARLRSAVAGLPDDLPVTTLLRREPAPAALLAELRSGAYDLVVVGRGRRRSRVAQSLLRRGHVPVIVVNAGRPAPSAPPARARNLVAQGA